MFHWRFLITYIFSVALKLLTCYITDKWDEFTVKIRMLLYTDIHILSWQFFFVCFLLFIYIFIILISFFDKVSNFHNRIPTNQKLEIGDKKLSQSKKRKKIEGELRAWNFKRYWKKKMLKFQGPRIEFTRMIKKKSCGISMSLAYRPLNFQAV